MLISFDPVNKMSVRFICKGSFVMTVCFKLETANSIEMFRLCDTYE